jgi:hypothetical protein
VSRRRPPGYRVPRDPERRPLREVTSAQLREVRTSFLGPDTPRRSRRWDLLLSCGHRVDRAASYPPRPAGAPRANGWHPRGLDEILSAPTRARCDTCPKGTP